MEKKKNYDKKLVKELFDKYFEIQKNNVKDLYLEIEKKSGLKDISENNAMYNIIETNLILNAMKTISGQGNLQENALKGFVSNFFKENQEKPIYIG